MANIGDQREYPLFVEAMEKVNSEGTLEAIFIYLTPLLNKPTYEEYNAIRFNSKTGKPIKGECKRYNEVVGDGDKIWSFASIDRIDSTQPYSYDNVEIISAYYNTQVKNCASISQVCKLYHYQLKNLIDKKINKVGVKVMTDDVLCKSFEGRSE